jgi:DNA-binding MarR family transcriptional regulator
MPLATVESNRAERHFDSRQQEAFLVLWRTWDRLRAIEDRFFARYGLTAQQYNALRILRAAHPEPLPTLGIGERLVTQAPDVTRLVDKLVRRGLVERQRPADNRRTVHVRITAAGIELLRQIARPLRECHERQLGHLDEQQLTQLIGLLHQARAPHEETGSVWK